MNPLQAVHELRHALEAGEPVSARALRLAAHIEDDESTQWSEPEALAQMRALRQEWNLWQDVLMLPLDTETQDAMAAILTWVRSAAVRLELLDTLLGCAGPKTRTKVILWHTGLVGLEDLSWSRSEQSALALRRKLLLGHEEVAWVVMQTGSKEHHELFDILATERGTAPTLEMLQECWDAAENLSD